MYGYHMKKPAKRFVGNPFAGYGLGTPRARRKKRGLLTSALCVCVCVCVCV